MDATLQIIIRAQARQAQAAVAQTTNQLNGLQRAAARVNGAGLIGFFDALGSNKLIKAGKNLQWIGRQLVYNFTLPLGLAGVALFRFTQDVERELTQLRKVYGDAAEDQAMLRKETDALAQSFTLLSSYFGVHNAEVAKIGAMWAQAGSAGRGLAENTKATLEAMILGDMDAVQATERLIAIQGTWRLSTKKNKDGVSDLHMALAQLNIIENQTGISFEGLMDVYQRAGGVARQAGMEFSDLGHFAAALVPATGSAAQAGNSLRTIISRLQAPTRETIDVLARMGIEVMSPDWLGKTATQKLETMATQFAGLSQANKNFVSSIIASRWQVNRFNVLMDDIASGTGYYNKALQATSDDTNVLNTYNRELQTVLQSSPKRWDIMTNSIRNAMADAFIPLLPAIFEVMRMITQLAQAFANLSPQTQKFIIFGLAAVALVGPILVLIGSFSTLIGVISTTAYVLMRNLFVAFFRVGQIMTFLAMRIIPLLVSVLGSLIQAFIVLGRVALVMVLRSMVALFVFLSTTLLPAFTLFGAEISVSLLGALLAIGLIVGAIMLILNDDFRGGVWDVIQSVIDAFWKLPEAIAAAFNAVIRVLAKAMEVVAEALSYLNPFARHSPSLVDSVKAGVSTILNEYARLTKITPLIQNSINALNDFGMANSGLRMRRRESELREKASQPGVQGGDQIVNAILALEAEMPNLTREISTQRMVVAQWDRALADADAQLETLERQLESSEAALDSVTEKIDAANAEIDRLANVPLTGMQAMEDQLFANEMATKELQLRMLEFERAGVSIDEIREKYALLNGEIEMLSGERETLRLAGAGSDILKTYDDQIAALQGQKDELRDTQDEIQGIQDQLDSLDLERRFLDLTKSLTFDPLVRSIDQIVNGIDEMDYDAVVAAIREQQAIVTALIPQQEQLQKQVDAERIAVEAAQVARNAIADQLDIEQQKLDGLEQAYNDINALIREMENLLSDVSTAAVEEAAEKSKSFVDEMFDAGLGVDYPIVGTDDILDREGTLADIEAFNKEMEQMLEDMLAQMGIGNMFDPIKEQWNKFKGWLDGWWQKFKGWFDTAIAWIKEHWILISAVIAAPWILGFGALFLLVQEFGPKVLGWLNEHLVQPMVDVFQSLWDQITGVFEAAWGVIQTVWEVVGVPVFEAIKLVVNAYIDYWTFVWNTAGTILGTAWEVISGIFTKFWDAIDGYLIPILELFQVTFLIIWELIKRNLEAQWQGIKAIWDAMVFVLRNGLVPAFEWTRDRIKQVWDAAGAAIKWTWDNVISPVFTAIDWAIHNLVQPAFDWLKTNAVRTFDAMGWALRGVWDNVISPIFGFFRDAFENVVAPAFQWLYEHVIKRTWGAITSVFSTAWNGIAASIEGGVNFFISAFNKLADAVNKVASLLGIDQRVSHMDPINIPGFGGGADFQAADRVMAGAWRMPGSGGGSSAVHLMAAGGKVGRAGGPVTGMRAIVGEGSNIYPEYVVPTDPRYKNRALGLYSELGKTLMGGDGLGDIFGSAKKMASGAIGKGLGLLKTGAIKAIWDPAKAIVQGIINQIPNSFFRGAGSGILGMVDNWMRGTDQAWESAVKMQTGSQPVDGSGSWTVIPPFLQRLGIPYKILSTFRPGATTRFTGNQSWHALNRAIDLSGPSGMINYNAGDLLEINHAIYQGFKPWLKELIYGGPGAKNVFRGQDHTFSGALMREHINHVHAALARGGFVVPRRPGGAVIRVGEGAYDEKVQVMPLNNRDRDGGDTYNFYGDLSFPGITSGDDAEKFLTNLEALSGR